MCFNVIFVRVVRNQNQGYIPCKFLNRLVLICFIFISFLFAMHEIDTAVEVHLEPFQTYAIEIFSKSSYTFCLLSLALNIPLSHMDFRVGYLIL